jgi:transposase
LRDAVSWQCYLPVFLKRNRRVKNGREFIYYNIVENRRCAGGRVVQRQVLYLGELNSTQLEQWRKSIEVFDETTGSSRQLALFEQGNLPEASAGEHVEIRLSDLKLCHPRQWGACWIALQHWDLLDLDRFFGPRLGRSRKGTNWLAVLKILVCYRLIDPGSEWRLHRDWFLKTAMGDLLGEDFSIVQKDKLYDCHDLLLTHKQQLFSHLRQRWADLFGARFEVLLYDLTSTYFESEPRDPESGDKRRFGHSRDRRSDCVQVIIALIVTPEGFPLAYEVMDGNTADKTTLREFLKKIETQYGKAERTWVMDRGIPTEEVLEEMRRADPPVRYLVGTPKGRLTKLEESFAEKPWEQVREQVDVKLLRIGPCEESEENAVDAAGTDRGKRREAELYILARSHGRVNKERAMRRRALKRLWARLGEIKAMKRLTREECFMKLGAARKEAGRVWGLVDVTPAPESADAREFTYNLRKDRLRAQRRREGRYLLRSNLDADEVTPTQLWKHYIQLVEVEEAFKNLKGDLAIRPVHHQKMERVEAHIFISFLAYCLHVTMRQRLRTHAPGLTPRELLAKFAAVQMVDVHLPASDGRELVMSRYTQPDDDLRLLIAKLQLELPQQSPPRISSAAVPKAGV